MMIAVALAVACAPALAQRKPEVAADGAISSPSRSS
jgi:hypothetical protein